MALGVEVIVVPATGDVLTNEFALAGPAIPTAMRANNAQASLFLNFIIPPASHNSPLSSHFFTLRSTAPRGQNWLNEEKRGR